MENIKYWNPFHFVHTRTHKRTHEEFLICKQTRAYIASGTATAAGRARSQQNMADATTHAHTREYMER